MFFNQNPKTKPAIIVINNNSIFSSILQIKNIYNNFNTYIRLAPSPINDVINIIVAFTSYSLVITLCTASTTSIPVITQISSTETRAPITSARYHPNDSLYKIVQNVNENRKDNN